MIKNIIVFFLVFITQIFANAQTGGYMGRKHHFSIDCNFHPAGVYSQLGSNVDKDITFTLRPGYEWILGKSFSLGVDVGFLNYNGGENQASSGSILFMNQSQDNSFVPRYYVSGFDARFKLNLYNYKQKGVIAPLGAHYSLLFAVPVHSTAFSETAIFKTSEIGVGFELGKRSIITGFVTIEYGLSTVYSLGKYSSFTGTSIEEKKYLGYSSSTAAESDYFNMQVFSLYLKIGYLL